MAIERSTILLGIIPSLSQTVRRTEFIIGARTLSLGLAPERFLRANRQTKNHLTSRIGNQALRSLLLRGPPLKMRSASLNFPRRQTPFARARHFSRVDSIGETLGPNGSRYDFMCPSNRL